MHQGVINWLVLAVFPVLVSNLLQIVNIPTKLLENGIDQRLLGICFIEPRIFLSLCFIDNTCDHGNQSRLIGFRSAEYSSRQPVLPVNALLTKKPRTITRGFSCCSASNPKDTSS